MTMSASEVEVIRNVIARLQPDARRTSDDVFEALSDRSMRLFLDTWVISALECLLPERRDLKLAKDLSR